MINLISTSSSRAEILREYKIPFKQFFFEFDETIVNKSNPNLYSYRVVMEKAKQFKENLKNTLFADSSVVCGGLILGKPQNLDEARYMLNLQNNSYVRVISAMIYKGENLTIYDNSYEDYKFAKFDEKHIEDYLKSDKWRGKAGGMMIEDFNKRYIVSGRVNSPITRGLNVEVLRAFL